MSEMSERKANLKVGVVMGSESDLPTMQHAGRALTRLGLGEGTDYEVRIKSAHRTPQEMAQYAEEAEERGLEVIIAGAGGSAHLPGMLASETLLPVIGVSVTDSQDTLNRALGSMIGMPEGVPLAIFQGEKGAFNAGLMAARILAVHNPVLKEAYYRYQAELRTPVVQVDRELAEGGTEAFLRKRRLEEEEKQFG